MIVGTHRSEFTYDALQRRVREVERADGVVLSDNHFLWCDVVICEERDTTVTRRALRWGEQVAGQARLFTTDHLGSICEVTESAGTELARYGFDPWGRRTVTGGSDVTRVGFTGHGWQAAASLWLTLYRAYDNNLGRWISQDPAGHIDGVNLYVSQQNSPTLNTDPLGLWAGGAGMAGGYTAAAYYGVTVEGGCQVVFDGQGNVGVMCCGQGGAGFGLGAAGGIGQMYTVCPTCLSICDLDGYYAGGQIQGGNVSGSATASTGGLAASLTLLLKGAGEAYAGVGVVGKCGLVWKLRECKTC